MMTHPGHDSTLRDRVNERLAAYSKSTRAYRAAVDPITFKRTIQIGSLAAVAPLVASVGDAQAQVNCYAGPGLISFNYVLVLAVGPMRFGLSASRSNLGISHFGPEGGWISSRGDAVALNDSSTADRVFGISFADLCADGTGQFCPTDGPGWIFSTDNPRGFVELEVISISGHTASVDVSWVQIGSTHAGDCPISLPVELVSFDAVVDGGKVQLRWETASELLNAGFEIQRATSTDEYSRIAFVDGHGTTDQSQTYTWSDDEIEPNVRYKYRLKQIDFDGTSSFSHVIEVFTEDPSRVALSEFYPNPGRNGRAGLDVNVAESSEVTIEVFDVRGALLASKSQWLDAGQNRMMVETRDLAVGPHFARITVGERVQYRQFVVAH